MPLDRDAGSSGQHFETSCRRIRAARCDDAPIPRENLVLMVIGIAVQKGEALDLLADKIDQLLAPIRAVTRFVR